jgi:hypothetical protein
MSAAGQQIQAQKSDLNDQLFKMGPGDKNFGPTFDKMTALDGTMSDDDKKAIRAQSAHATMLSLQQMLQSGQKRDMDGKLQPITADERTYAQNGLALLSKGQMQTKGGVIDVASGKVIPSGAPTPGVISSIKR